MGPSRRTRAPSLTLGLALGLTVAAGLACDPRPTSPPPSSVDLAWMVGTWRAESGDEVTVETWRRRGDGGLEGENETRVEGRLAHAEILWILVVDGAWTYRAGPSNQPAHDFVLVDAGARYLRFSDPEHDWPQHISYRREGSRLSAIAWGETGDDERVARWDFLLVDDDP